MSPLFNNPAFIHHQNQIRIADSGKDIPVTIYRLLEYSIREQLIRQFGKETQIQVFQDAGSGQK